MIITMDSELLKNIFIGGYKNLELNKSLVDSLNVFPVPDGDTGTNMSMTAKSACKELEQLVSPDIKSVCEAITKGSLKGARGNSGVILSQIFKGICSVLSDKDDITPRDFAVALKNGAKVAYSAVAKPKEGTILTVIRVISEDIFSLINRNTSFEKFFEDVITLGRDILDQTPNMLPVLKKAGVVDAGGFGLICVFEGMLKVITGEEITLDETKTEEIEVVDPDLDELEDIKFAYCTEFFITNIYPKTTTADIEKLREKLSNIGDSLICIGDLTLVKVHVHTNTPGKALNYAVELGELDKVKIENMLIQHRALVAKRESEKKSLGIIAVCSGDGYSKLYKEMGVDYVIEGGQSMNPSVDDFSIGIRRVNADNILILPNNKNILLAAIQAADVSDKHCVVVPTESVQSGLSALVEFDPEVSAEKNSDHMLSSIQDMAFGSVTKAVRNVNMNGLKVKEGNYIGLSEKKILTNGLNLKNVVVQLVGKLGAEEKDVLTLYYGKDVKEEECQEVVEALEEKYPDLEVLTLNGGQPHYYYELVLE